MTTPHTATTPGSRIPDADAIGRLSRRRFLGLSVLAATAGGSLLTACSSQDVGARVLERHKDGILQVGVAAAPSNINPLDSGSEVTRWIAEPVVESLYTYDDALKSVPLLAVGEPEISADELTWTIGCATTSPGRTATRLSRTTSSRRSRTSRASLRQRVDHLPDQLRAVVRVDRRPHRAISLIKPYGLLRSHLTNLPIVHKDFVDSKNR